MAVPRPSSARRAGSVSADAADGMIPGSRENSHPRPAVDWVCVAAARNILVVDDNDRHLDILSAILTSVGHDVETCGSGAEAIRRMEARRFDVIVLDIVMPEVSGLVVARQMRQSGLNRRTPIIACTANMAIARKQLAEIPDVTAFIGKPIDTANLILAVAKAPVRQRRSDRIRL
jgi:CheY-like chemotaxis protein